MSDIDIGKMIYNHALDPRIQKYCGVDLSPYFQGVNTWEVWERCVMGIRSAPHGCTRMELLGEEVAKGSPKDKSNPFAFSHVRLNLPGDPAYCPSMPWVSKVSAKDGRIASDVKTYVDDIRVTGPTKPSCDLATRRAASFLTYLGEQDACRKRAPSSHRAGAWAGSVCHTDSGAVTVMVTGDKWLKARGHIQYLLDIANTTNQFDHKDLERIRGFLIYVVRTYPAFTPYLKGIHLTLDSWRPGRRWDGWRDVDDLLPEEVEALTPLNYPPATVTGVPRLILDLQALAKLFEPLTPPRRIVRTNEVAIVMYGYGDASHSGFGSSFVTPSGVHVRHGLWGRDISHHSSNFRKLQNLADTLEFELEDQFPILRSAVETVSSLLHQEDLEGLEIFCSPKKLSPSVRSSAARHPTRYSLKLFCTSNS